MRPTNRVVGILAATTLTLTTLTACGNNDDTDSGGTSDTTTSSADTQVSERHNDADVEFASGMIPHHAQAVEMAKLAEDRAESQEVKDLATDIEAAQGPEIDLLSTMLKTWGEDVPDPDAGTGDMGGMEHGAAGDNLDDMDDQGHDMGSMGGDSGDPSEGMSGMMSEDDMAALMDASGVEFDQMFLGMMVEHHRGAIDMAQTEQSDGENPQAVDLAAGIEAAQTDEVASMEELLGS
jgi:uncharacterized protein (DUF305 family)